MAHWLSWMCGTSMVAAREQVRVGLALDDLPVIRDRFCAGRLSYSQVRAVTRVATAETDELLADLADALTAAQLEEVVRAFRRSNEVDADVADRRRDRRELSTHWDDDGMLVGRFRLPPEEGALFTKAIDASARHHHRHHEGGFRIEHPRAGKLIFVGADGREIPDRPPRRRCTSPGGGLRPAVRPFESHWEGGPTPMDDILYVLHQAAGTLIDDSAETRAGEGADHGGPPCITADRSGDSAETPPGEPAT